MTIINPESIGDPNQTPLVRLTPDLVALLDPCRQRGPNGEWCGGVNGFHRETCPRFDARAEQEYENAREAYRIGLSSHRPEEPA